MKILKLGGVWNIFLFFGIFFFEELSQVTIFVAEGLIAPSSGDLLGLGGFGNDRPSAASP